MKDRVIYEVGKPFYIEVVFDGEDINLETDNILTKAIASGGEILPGLKLKSIFAKFVDKDLLVVDSLTDDLQSLRDTFDNFIRKYECKKESIRERNINTQKGEEV